MPRPLRSRHAAPFLALPLALAALAGALPGCSGSTSGGGGTGAGSCPLPAASSLSVVSVTPASGATNVFVSTDVTVHFNTCVDTTSFGPTSIMLMGGGGFVQTALAYDGATATLTIHPSAPLAYATTYLLSLMGLRGAQGETMATAFSSSFKTQLTADTTPPTTVASPAGGSYRTAQSVTLTCTDNVGGTGCAGTHYTADGSAPTLASPLYAAPISIAANTVLRFFSVDVQGNAETPKQESYVIDTTPPTLVSNVPLSGAAAVPLTQVLTATFSEAMAPATLGPGTVTADNGLTFGFAWNATTFTLTLTPTERLVCGTTYHVSIGPGATDLAGNALVQPATFSFATSTDCVEPVTTASLAGGVYRTAPQSVTLGCTDAGSGCARIVYTTDGTMPSLYPVNGTVVAGSSAGPISIGVGDTTLRWFAEDNAGNREAVKQQLYTVSTSGFTFVALTNGIARGVGPAPTSFVPLLPGGLTNVFVRDPSNGRLYRGTGNGLYVAEPGSEAFTLLPGSPPGVISVLPQGSKLFVGASGGLFVSTDGGATFAQRTLGTIAPGTYGAPAWVKAIVAQGTNVWAATDGGVAYSTDLGESFAMQTTASGLGSNAVNDLAFAAGTLYAATANGVSRSTDNGVTFTNVTAGLGSPTVNALAVSAGATTQVFAATTGGVSISGDGGASFTSTVTSGLGSSYVDAIAFDGTYLYAVTGDPVVSGTTNTFSISNAALTSFTPHALTPSNPSLRGGTVQVEGTTTKTVRVGAYPSYYLSTDGGLTFASMDLRGAVQRIVSVPAATPAGATLYAALTDSSGYGGVAISTDLGGSFVVRNQDNGLPYQNVSDVAASGSNVYAATFWGLGVSTNGGTTFTTSTALATGVDAVWAGGSTVWVGDSNGNLLVSTNSGTSFTQKASTGGSEPFAIDAAGTNVYAANSNGLSVSTNSGTSFTAATGLTYVTDVAVDGAGNVLASNNGTLYVAPSPGTTFALPGASPGSTGGVYAQGTTWYAALGANGVATSQDAGASWTTVPVAPASAWLSAHDVWYVP